MPYVEILSSSDPSPAAKQAFVTALTEQITREFAVSPAAVTVFFQPFGAASYAYRGELGHSGPARVFIKIHAYRRFPAPRRAIAMPLSAAAARCFGTTIGEVSLYFFERSFDEVVHDGELVGDGAPPAL